VRRANRPLRAAIVLGALAAVATAVAVLSTQGTVAARASFGALPLDHYACYAAKFNAFKPRPVRLENQFGRATARVLRPIRICAPAQKNAEPMLNRIAHLVCYSLTGVQGPDQESRTVSLTNQFGVLPAKVLVVPPEALCLPASKRLGTLTPPRAVPTNLDHYVCYSIDPSRPFQRRKAKVRDQFGSFTDAILAPKTLCVPTRKNGSKLVHPRVHLVCYSVKSGARGRPALLRNQYGVLRTTPSVRNLFCVPSLKRLTLH
jgi:hypothetical protein